MWSKSRIIVAALAVASLAWLTGCMTHVVQPYRHKTIYESVYGRKPPYDEELQQMYVTQGK